MPENTDPLLEINQENPKEDLLPWEENAGKINEEELKEEIIPLSEKKIIDINIASLSDIVSLTSDKEYEYVLIEPDESEVKITFRQDNIDASVRYVKYASYSSIILALKKALDMVIEVTNETQEGKKKTKIGDDIYLIGAKIVPGDNGERVWLKVKKELSGGVQKKQKVSLSVIFGFLTAILFVALVLGGAFIAFIVLNANTIDDVRFFASLGINLNDINAFIRQMVRIIFSILMFICTIVLSIGLFKFFFTKKVFRRKKILYGFLSLLLLMLTFATGSAWMFMEQKVNNLPNWQEQAYGDLKIFDNDLKNSGNFTDNEALLSSTDNLIGPLTLLFDLENFQNNKAREGFSIQRYIWNFGGEIQETFSPQINRTFLEIGNYPVSIEAIGIDIAGQEIRETITSTPTISIRNTVEVEEIVTNSGGKKISLNAQNLQNLGSVVWYLKEAITETNPNPTYPEWTKIDEGYQFIPGKIFFDEVYIGLSLINNENTTPENIDKVIMVRSDGESEIQGEIGFEQAFDDEFLFTFFVENVSTNFSDGFIENYEWNIESKTYREVGNIENPSISPKINHIFDSYGDKTISVTLTDSKGKTETLSKNITIQKQVQLRTPLIITNTQGQEIENLKREEKQNEYYINELGVPATLVFDARLVRPESPLYTLQEVSWDIDNDGNIDGQGTDFEYEIATEGNHTLSVSYSFQHRRNIEDVITLKEVVYIQGVRKDAILDLQLEYDSNYAPVTVRFDASKSYIKNDDIVKFIYDYGDGVIEERDAINPGHKYTEAGDYIITLTVRGKTGRSYSTSKELILLPPPQSAKITTSLKNAPIGQEIDFSSSESEGQIVEYFWNFGDGNISTEANPSHSYKKDGKFTVILQAEFSNNNTISDEMEIVITK